MPKYRITCGKDVYIVDAANEFAAINNIHKGIKDTRDYSDEIDDMIRYIDVLRKSLVDCKRDAITERLDTNKLRSYLDSAVNTLTAYRNQVPNNK